MPAGGSQHNQSSDFNKRKVKALLDAAPDSMLLIEPDGRVLECNAVLARRLGRRRDELLGSNIYDYLPEETAEQRRQWVRVAVDTRRPLEFEDSRDGRIMHNRLNPISNPAGEVAALAIYSSDITDRRRAEKELRRERDRAERYLEVVGVIVIALDARGRVTLMNRKGCEVLGVKRDEIIDQDWFDKFIPVEDRRRTKTGFAELIAGRLEAAEYFENAVITPDGRKRLIAWHNKLLKDDNGNIVGTLSSGQDITDRSRAEEALRASEQRFRDLAELLPETIFEADTEGNLTFVNRGAYESFRHPRGEPYWKLNCLDMIAPEDRDRAEANMRSVMASGSLGLTEYTAIRRDGSRFPALIRSAPVKDAGRVVGLRGFVIDITEQKKAERALLDYQQRLRRLADALSQAEEQERRRVAEGLHDEVSQSLGGLSLHLQVLNEAQLTDRQKQSLEKSRKLLRKVSQAVRTLTFELCPPMLYESGLVPALQWLVEQFNHKYPAGFRLDADERAPQPDEGTRFFVFRAVNELLNNAARYAEAAEVRVRLRGHGGRLYLCVEDDGKGFDPAAAGANGASLRGFGLFSIRERVHNLGGDMDVKSAPGQGTRICIILGK